MSRQRTRFSGWSSLDAAGTGWRRNRDFVGWHTISAGLLGIAVPLLLGFAVGAFGELGTGPKIDDSPAGLKAAYPQLWQDTYDTVYHDTRVDRLAALVVDQREGSDRPWAEGFREGWRSGWVDAVTAMQEALTDSGIEEASYEWEILANLQGP